ncbi:MAG: 2Fe-2S iron-sulfur cluster-binding protein, partial [Bacteroidales bacterium]
MNKIITLTIDKKEIKAPEGANLLQVAKDTGIAIPHLCYHKKLTPTGACRLCLVKIKGTGQMVASCAIKAEEGMEVTAFDAELEEA